MEDTFRLPFELGDVDVVVGDWEDICRASAASNLKRFGFSPKKVHEAESEEEVLSKAMELLDSNRCGGTFVDGVPWASSAPVLLFLSFRMSGSSGLHCARHLCDLVSSWRSPGAVLAREPFLVCASSRSVFDESEKRWFHCTIPKTFEDAKLSLCINLCQRWWTSGGGEPSVTSHLSSASHLASAPGSRLGSAMSLGEKTSLQQMRAATMDALPSFMNDTSSLFSSGKKRPTYSLGGEEPWSGAKHGAMTSSEMGDSRKRGNNVHALEGLRPPAPPFEDVTCLYLVNRGSFGRVYAARWGPSAVALKVVDAGNEHDVALKASFEGALSASLAHPNLVQTFKHSTREHKWNGGGFAPETKSYEVWIVQEWCGLGSLAKKIARQEIVNMHEAMEVAGETASAACYLHSRNIIHGDLTPGNIMLSHRPSVAKGYIAKVSDFGVSRILSSNSTSIQTRSMGSVTHMPPELFTLRENVTLTKQVDIWAFGVIIWQLCTGKTPFEGLSAGQVILQISRGYKLELPPNAHSEFAAVFRQCAERVPQQRVSFANLVQRFRRMLQLC
eukprot:TRINITY_DN60809_c0_g1_i1.p1 TRINITY_DN60809_c0_g1~~TRINITY_DN60809_c0_g1_i1.p1  ORF type:complete len:600 (-),score=82.01 TRINITY_DN60809_c0_g1_i1:155-1828(-)